MLQVDTAIVLDALCTCFPAIWAREEGDLRYPYFDRPGRPTIRPEGPVGSNRVGRSWVDPFLGRPGRPTCPSGPQPPLQSQWQGLWVMVRVTQVFAPALLRKL
jgi:hypothetical protein